MNNYGEFIATDTIRFERIFPGPVERVWAYLTESDKRGKWLASGEMELVEGGKAALFFRHEELSPIKAAIPAKFKEMENGVLAEEKVLKVEAPNLLTISWGGEGDVTFRLEPVDDKVRLTIVHRRLRGHDEKLSVSSGWHTHLEILAANLHGTEPVNFWTTFTSLEEKYAATIASQEG